MHDARFTDPNFENKADGGWINFLLYVNGFLPFWINPFMYICGKQQKLQKSLYQSVQRKY